MCIVRRNKILYAVANSQLNSDRSGSTDRLISRTNTQWANTQGRGEFTLLVYRIYRVLVSFDTLFAFSVYTKSLMFWSRRLYDLVETEYDGISNEWYDTLMKTVLGCSCSLHQQFRLVRTSWLSVRGFSLVYLYRRCISFDIVIYLPMPQPIGT